MDHCASRALVAQFLHKCCTNAQAASSPQPFHHSFFTKIKPAETQLRRPVDSLNAITLRCNAKTLHMLRYCGHSQAQADLPLPLPAPRPERSRVCHRHWRRRRMLARREEAVGAQCRVCLLCSPASEQRAGLAGLVQTRPWAEQWT